MLGRGVVFCGVPNGLTRSGKTLLGFPQIFRMAAISSALALLSAITFEAHSGRPWIQSLGLVGHLPPGIPAMISGHSSVKFAPKHSQNVGFESFCFQTQFH